MKKSIGALALLCVTSSSLASDKEPLRIMSSDSADTSYTVKVNGEDFKITRTMTSCAKNKGWLQPLVPVKSVNPITEIELLKYMGKSNYILVDMRMQDHYVEGAIPGAKNIPYTEVSLRLDELGCEKNGGGWNCSNAKQVIAYCNGPVCPQTGLAIKASVREGFPAENFHYYRGGMLDWEALGFPIVEPDF
jgi:rhodanese-related sulfurtransferase